MKRQARLQVCMLTLFTLAAGACTSPSLGTAAGCRRAALSRQWVEVPGPGVGESRARVAVQYDHRRYEACRAERTAAKRRRSGAMASVGR